mmetsp:Transcript_30799/g.77141  ORF Transcript_30799/g.77141 Transcript_30799/m.77141 type:complete len:269 (+) Transcript_30799:887-1693(+)
MIGCESLSLSPLSDSTSGTISTPRSTSALRCVSAAAMASAQYTTSPATITTRLNPRRSYSDTTLPVLSSHLRFDRRSSRLIRAICLSRPSASRLYRRPKNSAHARFTPTFCSDWSRGGAEGAPRALVTACKDAMARPREAFAANAPKKNMRATRNGACTSLRSLVALLNSVFTACLGFFFVTELLSESSNPARTAVWRRACVVRISDVELRLFAPIFPSDGHPPRVPSPDPRVWQGAAAGVRRAADAMAAPEATVEEVIIIAIVGGCA